MNRNETVLDHPASTDAPWSMHEITRLTGTTSRTLRHYDQIGLLEPSRIGSNGYRYYDGEALVRLQRILLLRDLGLGLGTIAEVLDRSRDEATALRAHLELLHQERDRLDRQIESVRTTVMKREGGEELMAEEMFDGFDHTRYKNEVEQRWGRDAYAKSDAWWRSLSDSEKKAFQQRQSAIGADYARAATQGLDPGDERVRAISARHHEWLGVASNEVSRGYFLGLADMYVADDRFAANYGGTEGATFVRDAMRAYAEGATFSGE
ncbi:MerR family transcriptional regulator [Occultella aeris]|uniref:HTH-type transcriptional activator TipA n=1 Tax=Occultella aeris TaxID=2761496 RepID=A0A7M4DE42_9MICO|nr:MerR family transcriptional regulator [Occultella aeris]VZO35156.1 HTH-type transcriptional activator TipA [Occultella aeris]